MFLIYSIDIWKVIYTLVFITEYAMSKLTKTIRMEPFWEEKLEDASERQDISFSELARRRLRFGLSKVEYRQLEELARRQQLSETEVVEQALKFTSIAMNPELDFSDAVKKDALESNGTIAFADAIKTMPEMAKSLYKKE